MAERRMFAKSIIDSDAFLEMPSTTQMLYFHLAMRADDEGFLNNPKRIMKMVGASEDDMKILLSKKFILAFESGVIVIKHWKIHNYIRGDRIKPTNYNEERSRLTVKENGAYTLTDNCQSNVSQLTDNCQHRLGKDRLGKDSIGEGREMTDTPTPYGIYQNVLLTEDEYKTLSGLLLDVDQRIDRLSEYMRTSGKTYSDHYATILSWAKKDEADAQKRSGGMLKHNYDYDAMFGAKTG